MMFFKYWKVFLLALTSFFWAGCDVSSSETECLYPPSEYQSSNSDKVESSTTIGDDEISCGSNKAVSSETASNNSVESSSSSSNGRAPVNCYTTSVKDTAGSSYSIFECDNGKKYLKDFVVYSEGLKDRLPKDILWSEPREGIEGDNCNFNAAPLCVDKIDSQGRQYGGCHPTIDCPYKPDTTTANCYATSVKNKDDVEIDIVECDDGHKWTREQAPFSICATNPISIPEDVTVGFPEPGGKNAKNCKLGPDTCAKTDCGSKKEYCAPTIDCPHK
ncbi:MAG: hypothetical protein IKC23_09340 [Fibrobacter sp.]|nr:hypothetical protein [Fibrobacter sp.]